MFWSIRHLNHLYVFWRGQIIYKNYDSGGPSRLFNNGWPGTVIVVNEIPPIEAA